MKSISINALCGKLEQTFAKKAAVKQQRIEWDIAENLALKGVPDEIESAFSNLVDNAINYTPSNGVIKVSCHHNLTERKSTRLNSSHVRISYAVFCLKKKKKKTKIIT